MPSATLLLLGRWPVTRAHNAHHDLLNTHEMFSDRDVFVSDLDRDQSLRDVLADGAILSTAQRASMRIEVITVGNNSIVDGFGDIADSYTAASSITEAKDQLAIDADDCLRIVVLPDDPLTKCENDASQLTQMKLAANSKIQQALALTNALDLVHGFVTSSVADTFVVAYGALRFRNNAWEAAMGCVAFAPIGRVPVPSLTSTMLIPTLVLQKLGVDVSDNDLHHQEGACLTIDARNESHWTCIARLFYEKERYEIQHTFPARDIENLDKAFLQISHPSEWIIRDNQGVTDNLADDANFVQTHSTRLLSSCLPAIRDLVRRRATVMTEEILVEVETVAEVATENTSIPETTIVTPPAEEIPLPSIDWRARLLELVRDRHGEAAQKTIAQALSDVIDSVPQTLVLGDDGIVQKLQGNLPPPLLQHLCKTMRQISLPLADGTSTIRLYESKGNVRIGRVKLDLNNVIISEWLTLYTGIARKSSNVVTRRDIRDYGNRGAVFRFAKQYEFARALMHR